MQIKKTVFVCYRHAVAQYHAIAVTQALTLRGYDVFIDYRSIDAGPFEHIILEQVDARAHFLVLLAPGTLDRCHEPRDMLRREIERAIEKKRNVVPLMFESFDFKDVQEHLTDKLAVLQEYQGVKVPDTYFEEAMERLDTRFLNKSLELSLHPAPPEDQAAVARIQAEAAAAPVPTAEQLSAEQHFMRGYAHAAQGDHDAAIADYTHALKLNPDYAKAYNNRGAAHAEQGDHDAALADYTHALKINPDLAGAYNNRGNSHAAQGDHDTALADYTQALQLNPELAEAYYNRGAAHADQNDLSAALADFSRALKINPDDAKAYYNRGTAHAAQGDHHAALADFSHALKLNPNYAEAYYNRGTVYAMRDDYDAAIADYERALRLLPDNHPGIPEVQANLARVRALRDSQA